MIKMSVVFFRLLSLIAIIVAVGAVEATAGTFTAFGPKTYVRDKGKPATVTDSFSVTNTSITYTLQVTNDGISSGVVLVNGAEILGPSDFDQNVSTIQKQITLQMSNEISVELRSEPGSSITVQVIGVRPGFVVVANRNSNSATIIDPSTFPPTVLATLPIGGTLAESASVTPDGSTALISTFVLGLISFIDLTTAPPSLKGNPLSIGSFTESLAITTDGHFAITADGGCTKTHVSAIDIANQTIVSTLNLVATAAAITPDNGTVIIGDECNNQFSILTLSLQGVLTDTGVRVPNTAGTGQRTIAMAPNGHFALATDLSGALTILKIDSTSSVTVAGSLLLCCPTGVAITPDGTKAYVAMTDSTLAVLAINSADNVSDTGIRIPIPNGPPPPLLGVPGIAFSSDSTQAYVSNFNSNTVTILDVVTNAVVEAVPVGNGPAGIGVAR